MLRVARPLRVAAAARRRLSGRVVAQGRVLSSSSEEGRPRGQTGETGGERARWYQPWLSDKSLYPVIAITAVTVGFALWFGPVWLYRTPVNRIDPKRRQEVVYEKQEHETTPVLGENVYMLSRKLTKDVIYPATLGKPAPSEVKVDKDKDVALPKEEMGGQGGGGK